MYLCGDLRQSVTDAVVAIERRPTIGRRYSAISRSYHDAHSSAHGICRKDLHHPRGCFLGRWVTRLRSVTQSSRKSSDTEHVAALEQRFAPYIQAFLPFLYPALKAHEDTQLCTVAVGIIGDISRALGEQSAQYAHAFMSVLLENLQSDVLNRNVKISILSCFGDIALAIGGEFEPYMNTTMGVLRQAGVLQPNPVRCRLFLSSSVQA